MTAASRLRSLPGETISPRQLAEIIGGNPYSYNRAAKAGVLGIPFVWRGKNLRILKAPLIKILEGIK